MRKTNEPSLHLGYLLLFIRSLFGCGARLAFNRHSIALSSRNQKAIIKSINSAYWYYCTEYIHNLFRFSMILHSFQSRKYYRIIKSGIPNDLDTLKRLTKLELKVNESNTRQDYLLSIKNSIIALYFFIKKVSRDTIISSMDNLDWHIKHDILLKSFWMHGHLAVLLRKQVLKYPFRCQVGPPSERKNIDREFYIIDLFIKCINKAKQVNHLLFDKLENDPPDFRIVNKKYILGVEVTEVAERYDYYEDIKYRETFFSKIEEIFRNYPVIIFITQRASWPELVDNILNIIVWLKSILHNISDYNDLENKKGYTFADCDLFIDIIPTKGKKDFMLCDGTSDSTPVPSFDSVYTIIIDRIKEKNNSILHFEPSDLVIYLHYDSFSMDIKVLKEKLSTETSVNIYEIFQRIWFIDEKHWMFMQKS